MPQEPKKRHSRQRQGKRRASIRLIRPVVTFCANCGYPTPSYTVCKKCGYYKNKQIIAIKIPKKEEEKK